MRDSQHISSRVKPAPRRYRVVAPLRRRKIERTARANSALRRANGAFGVIQSPPGRSRFLHVNIRNSLAAYFRASQTIPIEWFFFYGPARAVESSFTLWQSIVKRARVAKSSRDSARRSRELFSRGTLHARVTVLCVCVLFLFSSFY